MYNLGKGIKFFPLLFKYVKKKGRDPVLFLSIVDTRFPWMFEINDNQSINYNRQSVHFLYATQYKIRLNSLNESIMFIDNLFGEPFHKQHGSFNSWLPLTHPWANTERLSA